MPRDALGARLYFDESRQNWVIRDGQKFIRTGAAGWKKAVAELTEYLKRRPKERRRMPLVMDGFIYFLTADHPGFPIKIGFTRERNKAREKYLQVGCPYPIVVLGMIPGRCADERRLHRKFAAQRLEGEWFARSEELMKMIGAVSADDHA
jgi:hypothetical protein